MSNENTHTPGPWEVFTDDSGGEWSGWPLCINAANYVDKMVVRTGGQWPYDWDSTTSQEEANANARLIAAAPMMLDALKIASLELGEAFVSLGLTPDRSAGKATIDAAIAKAEGRT